MTDDLAEALDAPHHSLADWLERQPVDDRNVGKVREIVRLLRSLPEAVEALREFDGNGPWITLASVTALLADADLPCQNPTVETWRIAGKPTVVPTDKRCGECANCALDMLRRGEQAEALADTLDKAVDALREKDRRIAGLAARLREYEGDTAWSREKADRDDWDWMTGRGRYAQ